MKTIFSNFTRVLIGTVVLALGTVGAFASPSVVVTNSFGSNLFKLYYKAEKAGKVRISIADENNQTVFREVVQKINAFMRPYNFEGLPEGKYTVTVEDESGKTVENVDYKTERIEKFIRVAKLDGDQNKVLLSISSEKPEDVIIYIFDSKGALVYNEIQTVTKQFAQVYNLSEIKSFRIEVWDQYGQLKKFVND